MPDIFLPDGFSEIGCFTRRDFWPSSGQNGPKKYAALILAVEFEFEG